MATTVQSHIDKRIDKHISLFNDERSPANALIGSPSSRCLFSVARRSGAVGRPIRASKLCRLTTACCVFLINLPLPSGLRIKYTCTKEQQWLCGEKHADWCSFRKITPMPYALTQVTVPSNATRSI